MKTWPAEGKENLLSYLKGLVAQIEDGLIEPITWGYNHGPSDRFTLDYVHVELPKSKEK